MRKLVMSVRKLVMNMRKLVMGMHAQARDAGLDAPAPRCNDARRDARCSRAEEAPFVREAYEGGRPSLKPRW